MKVKPGALWWAGDSKYFRVIRTESLEDHEWVYYRVDTLCLLYFRRYDTGFLQYGQMLGNDGLRLVQAMPEVANAGHVLSDDHAEYF